MGSLIAPDHFTHILRVLNTNVDGRNKIMYAMTNIRGIGRRFSDFACKKGEVDKQKRAGECSAEDIENLMLITSNPRAYKTPDWFLNRQKVRLRLLVSSQSSLPLVVWGRRTGKRTKLARRFFCAACGVAASMMRTCSARFGRRVMALSLWRFVALHLAHLEAEIVIVARSSYCIHAQRTQS
jgi:ribosomal protein S13